MGVGRSSGKDKAENAANMAISSPLLETAINGATGVIINITSSPDVGLDEIETASMMISEQADASADIIWGAAFDEEMEDEISVTVIATGFATRDKNIPTLSPAQKSYTGKKDKSKEELDDLKDNKNDKETKKVSESSKIDEVDDDDAFYDIMSIFNRK